MFFWHNQVFLGGQNLKKQGGGGVVGNMGGIFIKKGS